jgi:uncharacterized membrane protein YbhN (UPF0104 family)
MMLSGLTMAGIEADKAGAIAVIFHAIGYVTIALMGIYFFSSLKISFKDIRKTAGQTADPKIDIAGT